MVSSSSAVRVSDWMELSKRLFIGCRFLCGRAACLAFVRGQGERLGLGILGNFGARLAVVTQSAEFFVLIHFFALSSPCSRNPLAHHRTGTIHRDSLPCHTSPDSWAYPCGTIRQHQIQTPGRSFPAVSTTGHGWVFRGSEIAPGYRLSGNTDRSCHASSCRSYSAGPGQSLVPPKTR